MSESEREESERDCAVEAVVRPGIEVVDSHIHLWDQAGQSYLARNFLEDARSGHNVVASVHVECGMAYDRDAAPQFQPVGETRYIAGQAEEAAGSGHALAAAIMGSADMLLGAAVRPVLEAHREAGAGRFRGIRYRAAWDADPQARYGPTDGYPAAPGAVRQPAFEAAARVMSELGLVLEIWAFHTQLGEVMNLAARCPDLTIGVNHIGGPLGLGSYAGQGDDVFRSWSANIRSLSAYPNVQMKIGGLGTSRMGFLFRKQGRRQSSDEFADGARQYILTCLDAFGPGRCYFGSNFPVDRSVCSYRVYLNAFKKIMDKFSEDENRAVFSVNARRIFRLTKLPIGNSM